MLPLISSPNCAKYSLVENVRKFCPHQIDVHGLLENDSLIKTSLETIRSAEFDNNNINTTKRITFNSANFTELIHKNNGLVNVMQPFTYEWHDLITELIQQPQPMLLLPTVSDPELGPLLCIDFIGEAIPINFPSKMKLISNLVGRFQSPLNYIDNILTWSADDSTTPEAIFSLRNEIDALLIHSKSSDFTLPHVTDLIPCELQQDDLHRDVPKHCLEASIVDIASHIAIVRTKRMKTPTLATIIGKNGHAFREEELGGADIEEHVESPTKVGGICNTHCHHADTTWQLQFQELMAMCESVVPSNANEVPDFELILCDDSVMQDPRTKYNAWNASSHRSILCETINISPVIWKSTAPMQLTHHVPSQVISTLTDLKSSRALFSCNQSEHHMCNGRMPEKVSQLVAQANLPVVPRLYFGLSRTTRNCMKTKTQEQTASTYDVMFSNLDPSLGPVSPQNAFLARGANVEIITTDVQLRKSDDSRDAPVVAKQRIRLDFLRVATLQTTPTPIQSPSNSQSDQQEEQVSVARAGEEEEEEEEGTFHVEAEAVRNRATEVSSSSPSRNRKEATHQQPARQSAQPRGRVSLEHKEVQFPPSAVHHALSERVSSASDLKHHAASTSESDADTTTASALLETMPAFELPNFDAAGMMEEYMRLQQMQQQQLRRQQLPTQPPPHKAAQRKQQEHEQQQHEQQQGIRNMSIRAGASTAATAAAAAPLQAQNSTERSQKKHTSVTPDIKKDAFLTDAIPDIVNSISSTNDVTALQQQLLVLVSERFVEQFPLVVSEAHSTHNVLMADAPLQKPISIIVDPSTAIVLCDANELVVKSQLKLFIKSLSEVSFKYTTIYVIIQVSSVNLAACSNWGAATAADRSYNSNNAVISDAILTVCQATTKFPAQIILRQWAVSQIQTLTKAAAVIATGTCTSADAATISTCTSTSTSTSSASDIPEGVSSKLTNSSSLPAAVSLAKIVSDCCHHARKIALSSPKHSVTSSKYLQRPFLSQMSTRSSNFMHQCQFLQMFPTINFYMAVVILHRFRLRDLVELPQTTHICNYLQSQHVLTDELVDRLEKFLLLLRVHVGIPLATSRPV